MRHFGGLACALLLGLGSGGCLDDAAPCADGSLCRGALVCAPVEIGGCAEPGQAEACVAPAVDGDACDYGFVSGVCLGGLCRLSACGDGIVDPTRGEVCDEGDNLAGDGCSADCRSDEVCGNGVIDDAVGEQCDDGNTNDHDGCQGTCVLQRCGDGVLDRLDDEVCDDGNNGDGDGCAADCRSDETCGNGVVDYLLAEACDDGNELGDDACSASCRPVARWRWRSLSSPPTPAARYDAVVVADPAHDEVLMFGGAGAARFGDTWTWRDRGTDLADAAPAWAPSPRQGATAAYDVRRGEVILFGGYDAHGVLLDETWAWNGGSWRRVPTAVAPPARRDHAMAWAAELGDGGEVLLFGGAAAEPLGDTWAWDGTAWRALTPASSPPARRGAAVVADPVSGDVVLFGGSADPATFFDDTWRWAAGTWTLAPASGPSGRVDAAMAARPRPMGQATDVLLFGGRASDGAPLGDTWRWDGAAWTELAVSGPPARAGAGLVALPGTDQLLLTGGLAESAFDDDWRWDGSAWTQPDPAEVFGESGTRVGLDPYRGVVFAERNQTLYARSAAGFVPDLVLTGQGFALGFDNDRRVTVLVEPHEDDEMWIWERADDGWALVHVATVAGGVATNLLSLPGGGVGWLHGTTLRTWDGVTLSAIASFADSPEAWLMGTDLGTGEILMIEPSATVTWNGVTRVEHAGLPPIAAGQESAYNATPHPVTGDLWFLSRDGNLVQEWHWHRDLATWELQAPDAGAPVRGPASYQVTDSVRARTERFGGFHVGGNPNTDPHMAYEARGIPREACTTGLDGDGDGHRGCDDPDCWAVCTPLCPPYLPACPADAPRCGDGTCDPLEACTSCALDCGACVGGTCGDGRCDPDEADGGGCPGDCGA